MSNTTSINGYNDFQGIAELRGKAQQDQSKAIDEVATQFEGMFLNMMLKEMRKTVPESELFNSPSMRLFTDMQDQQIALNMAKEGPLGIANLLKANLQGQGGNTQGEAKELNFEAALDYLQKSARAFELQQAQKTFELPQKGVQPMALDSYQAVGKEW